MNSEREQYGVRMNEEKKRKRNHFVYVPKSVGAIDTTVEQILYVHIRAINVCILNGKEARFEAT